MIITSVKTGHEIVVPDDFTPITMDEAIFGMMRAVQVEGVDYIDPQAVDASGCMYFIDETPSCIVGRVFAEKGITNPDAQETFNDCGGIRDVARHYPDLFEDNAVDILFTAQNLQDERETWGVAFNAAADEYMYYSDGVDPRC